MHNLTDMHMGGQAGRQGGKGAGRQGGMQGGGRQAGGQGVGRGTGRQTLTDRQAGSQKLNTCKDARTAITWTGRRVGR